MSPTATASPCIAGGSCSCHSWNNGQLYDAYDFAEPWDGPNNRKLADKVGRIYLRSGLESDQVRTTSFVAVVGPETAWRGDESLSNKDLVDGSHDTLLVVEVPDGQFLWMEPRDLRFDRMSFRINDGSGRGLGSRLGGARVVSADGTVRMLPDGYDPRKLRAMLTANGGETIPRVARSCRRGVSRPTAHGKPPPARDGEICVPGSPGLQDRLAAPGVPRQEATRGAGHRQVEGVGIGVSLGSPLTL